MSRSQPTKKCYNKIMEYLAENDEEMADLFSALYLEQLLQHSTGVTFLNPQDPAIRSKLNELTLSDDPADIKKATAMLSAYIIFDYLRTPDDFITKHDDLPNALRQRVVIDRTASNSYEVVLGKGKAIPCDFQTKKKIAVYNLTGHEIPTNGQPASMKYVKLMRNTKQAKKEEVVDEKKDISMERSRALRTRLANEQLSKFKYNISTGKHTFANDPFVLTVMSLIHFIITKEKETVKANIYFGRILPLLSFTSADFYILFEPYKSVSQYIIPNSTIEQWYSTRSNRDINIGKVVRQVWQDLESVKDKYSIYSKRSEIVGEIDRVRQEVHSNPGGARQLAEATLSAYLDLSKNNKVGDITDVYPPDIAELYSADPHRKALEDEMKYMLFNTIDELEKEYSEDDFEEFVDIIESYMAGKDSSHRRLRLLNSSNLEQSIAPRERLEEVRTFLNSTFFINVPLSYKDSTDDFPLLQAESNRPRKSTSFWNASCFINTRLIKLMPAEPETKNEARTKLKALEKQAKSGKLPKEVEEFLSKYNA